MKRQPVRVMSAVVSVMMALVGLWQVIQSDDALKGAVQLVIAAVTVGFGEVTKGKVSPKANIADVSPTTANILWKESA
jgi:hypothetical protein